MKALPIFDTSFVRQATLRENSRTFGIYKDLRLASVFQPIYSLAHKRIVGYEALVRAENPERQPVRPDLLFQQNKDLASTVFLDRLCRYIHIDNFKTLFNDDINWLFLNVSPQTITNGIKFGSFFTKVLQRLGLPPQRVVIEIVEYPFSTGDNRQLVEAVKYYQDLGCLTAIDDFGAGHSNFDRIWTLKPNIVKLDRSMLERATASREIRQLLPGIVSLLHQAGALVIMEGIETEPQAIIAMESDSDMVQGYYFAKPHHDPVELAGATPAFNPLFETYKTMQVSHSEEMQNTYQMYHKRFNAAVELLRKGAPIQAASAPLFEYDSVIRSWLLRPSGEQIGSTITSQVHAGKSDLRFKPLEKAKNADWFRRHYMQRAIMHPGQLQISRPYLSITGAHMCVTLSMMFSRANGDVILCCDLKV